MNTNNNTGTNTAEQVYVFKPGGHIGWTQDEEALLFQQVEQARSCGKPLKSVFDNVARLTGRKPNSIRNYYYARIKSDDIQDMGSVQCASFVPFTDEEIHDLLVTILTSQANGISVRACTLKMGNGDNKAMLRYQNKYRALVKNSPHLVKQVINELIEQGKEVFDPYENKPAVRRPGRPRKSIDSLIDIMSDVVNDLGKVEGLDVTAFFESLGTLAVSASRGAAAIQRLRELENGEPELETLRLKEKNSELMKKLDSQARELEAQKERFSKLLGMFRQLMNVNREFLGMTSVVKVSSLSSYIRELSQNVEDCERLMVEYVN